MITKQNVSSSVVVIGHLPLSGGDNKSNLLRDEGGPHRLPLAALKAVLSCGYCTTFDGESQQKPALDKAVKGRYTIFMRGRREQTV